MYLLLSVAVYAGVIVRVTQSKKKKYFIKNRTVVIIDYSDIPVSYFAGKCDLGKFWLSHFSTLERT